MSYNTVNFSIALDFNWLLAFVTLLTLIGSHYAYDYVIEADIFDDDTYHRELAVAGTASALLILGSAAGGVPVLVALLSVILGPWVIAAATVAATAFVLGVLYLIEDFLDSASERVEMTKRTLKVYAQTARNAAETAIASTKR